MARSGDSPPGARSAATLAANALSALAALRAEQDSPGDYTPHAHPWTDHLARLVRTQIAAQLNTASKAPRRHVVAARWNSPARLEDSLVEAARNPLYDLAWRVYPADCSRLEAQPLIAECVWRGGWGACAPACDRLAQGRADVKLLCVMADPHQSVGELSLAQACAFRISAFAPAKDHVLLAFYGIEGGWRTKPGFTLFDYVTGRSRLKPRA